MAQITIIGLGGIGGSLALALTRYMQQTEGKAQAFTLVGYDPDMDTQQAGLRGGDRQMESAPACFRDDQLGVLQCLRQM